MMNRIECVQDEFYSRGVLRETREGANSQILLCSLLFISFLNISQSRMQSYLSALSDEDDGPSGEPLALLVSPTKLLSISLVAAR
jgi:hypothetical protein